MQVGGKRSSGPKHATGLDADLRQLLEVALQGSVENKVNIFGEIIFMECKERFGEIHQKEPAAPRKERRWKEIEQLVRTRRQLRRRWKKTAPEEKVSLKELWDGIK